MSIFDSDYPHPQQVRATTVVNLNWANYDVYIGRAGRGEGGTFGNPIERGKPCSECGKRHFDNASIVKCYEIFLIKKLEVDVEFREKVRGLAGKTLGCFCNPKPCHGDVLARFADHLERLEHSSKLSS